MYARLKSESPKFFIKLQKFGIALVSAGTTGLVLPVIPGLVWPPFITDMYIYAVVIGTVIAFISKLTCQDPDKLDNSLKKP